MGWLTSLQATQDVQGVLDNEQQCQEIIARYRSIIDLAIAI